MLFDWLKSVKNLSVDDWLGLSSDIQDSLQREYMEVGRQAYIKELKKGLAKPLFYWR